MPHDISFGLAFTTGLLSFFAPCVLPLLPAWLTLATGLNYRQLADEAAKIRQEERESFFPKISFKIFWPTFFFVLGFFTVFVTIGAAIGFIGDFFYDYQKVFRYGGGAILVIFGLYILGVISPSFLNRERHFRIREKPVGLFGSFVVGLVFAASWSPCLGPTAGGIMFLAASQAGLGHGFWLLAVFSLGLALPFFIIALAWGSALKLIYRFQGFIPWARKLTGILILILAIMLISGYF